MQASARVLNFRFNHVYADVFTTTARYVDLWGGRGRGGSHSATEYMLFLITQPQYFRGCLMRQVFGDIRASLWQDFKDRLAEAIERGDIREGDMLLAEDSMKAVYKPTGNTLISKGFKKSSGAQSAKLKSLAGMTHIVIEECEEVDYDDFNKLDDSLRTTKGPLQLIRLFNPPGKNHWLIKRFYDLEPSMAVDRDGNLVEGWYKAMAKDRPDLLSIHTTYLDNYDNLDEGTKQKYRNYGDPDSPDYNPDMYYRDVCGLVSEGKKGRIFKQCYRVTLDLFRQLPYPSFYGLDFGFSQDPLALVEFKYHNGKLFRHQLIYETDLTNEALVKRMDVVGVPKKARIYADSAEPKSIATIRNAGYVCIPAVKGPDSILAGIKALQGIEVFTTATSTDLWDENEEYSWQLDSSKEPTDTPEDKNNHGWDATRYAYMTHVNKRNGSKVKVAGSKRTTDNRRDNWQDW